MESHPKQYGPTRTMIQVDIGGHPPIPLGPPPFSISAFQFWHNLLFLAVFRVSNFRSRFEALNDVFLGIAPPKNIIHFRNDIRAQRCSPRIYISNELLSASNEDRVPKLRPREVEPPIYPNGRPRFWRLISYG